MQEREHFCPAVFTAETEGQGERASGPTLDGALQRPWLVGTDHEATQTGLGNTTLISFHRRSEKKDIQSV